MHIETVAVAPWVTAVASCYKDLYQSSHISLDRRRWKRGQYADAVLVFCVYVPLLHSAQSGTTREVTAEHGEV